MDIFQLNLIWNSRTKEMHLKIISSQFSHFVKIWTWPPCGHSIEMPSDYIGITTVYIVTKYYMMFGTFTALDSCPSVLGIQPVSFNSWISKPPSVNLRKCQGNSWDLIPYLKKWHVIRKIFDRSNFEKIIVSAVLANRQWWPRAIWCWLLVHLQVHRSSSLGPICIEHEDLKGYQPSSPLTLYILTHTYQSQAHLASVLGWMDGWMK